MLTTCPECSGKLSSAAPACPHCGCVPKTASAPVSASPAAPPEPLPALLLPSEEAMRKAARLNWSEWVHSSIWRLMFGAVILVVALGLIVLVFLLAIRMNDGRDRQGRRDSKGRSSVEEMAWR